MIIDTQTSHLYQLCCPLANVTSRLRPDIEVYTKINYCLQLTLAWKPIHLAVHACIHENYNPHMTHPTHS